MRSSKFLLFYCFTFRSGIYFCLWCEVEVILGLKTVSQWRAPPNSWNCYLLWQSVCRVTKLKDLSKKDYPGLSSWVPDTTTCILVRGKQREISHTHTEAPMKMKQTEIDRKLLALWLARCSHKVSSAGSSRDGKRQKTDSLWRPPRCWLC